jgi:hypothetical protein
MDVLSKEWITIQEKAALEDVGCLLELISQLYTYRDRAQFNGKDYITIDIEAWKLMTSALVNIASSISGKFNTCYHLMRLIQFNQGLSQIISDEQVTKISEELLKQLNTNKHETVRK